MADDDEVLDLDAEMAVLAEMSAAADELLADQGPTSIVPVRRDPQTVKTEMAERRSALERKRHAVEAQAQRVRAALELQQAEIEARIDEMNAVVKPLREQVALAEEGIWTMNLYTGRDEGYIVLRDGEPAPADTPITVRQLTLYMDEECRLKAEDGGIDIDDLAKFDEWVLSDPENLDQLLPEPKGIVAMQPRREAKKYSADMAGMFEALRKDGTHQWTYWLIRNGDKLFRMFTDFDVGPRMIPAREEFTSFFQGTRGGHFGQPKETFPLEPGSDEWMKAEKQADARKRHFMRAALVLQGMVDRTTVFHPLPAQELSFLGPEAYDAGHVVVITDADSIGSGRQPYKEWMAELKAAVVPGMRVVFRATYEVREGRERAGRLHPRHAESPGSGVYVIEAKEGSSLVFRYEREEKRWGYEFPNGRRGARWDTGEWGQWPYQQKASCMLERYDDFWMPFDGVDVETLEDYMGARSERHAYMSLFPLMKAAIAAKKAEEAEEEPVRRMLVGELLKAGADQEAAEASIGELVRWWKTRYKFHRGLVVDDQAVMARAVKAIVKEFAARQAAVVDEAAEQAVVDGLRARYPELLYVGRRNDGRYMAYAQEDRVPYVVSIEISKTARSEKEQRWSGVKNGWRHWRELWSSEAWAGWNHTSNVRDFLSGPEIETAVAEIVEHFAGPQEATGRFGNDPVVRLVTVEDDTWYGDWAPNRSLQATFRQLPIELPDVERLLTQHPSDPKLYGYQVPWKRTRDGVELEFDSWISEGNFRVQKTTVLWSDDEVIAQLEAASAAREEADLRRRVLQMASSRAQDSIRKQWLALAERELYDRFIDDFMDPYLWEGHRKTLKDPVFPRELYQVLNELLDSAVERGLHVQGLTMATVRDQTVALGVKLDHELPEDLAELVVGAAPAKLPVDE